MNVFLSFSGDLSHKTALALEHWLPRVIQQITPFVSSEDIEKGSKWSGELAQVLDEHSYGVICLTRSNLKAEWLNFEAGALSKSVHNSRVTPFLLGLKRSEVKPTTPLGQFQLTSYEKGDVEKMVSMLNKGLGIQALLPEALSDAFNVWWPRLQEQLDPLNSAALEEADAPQQTVSVTQEDTLEEILELVREQRRLLSSPQNLLPREYIETLRIPQYGLIGYKQVQATRRNVQQLLTIVNISLTNKDVAEHIEQRIRQIDKGLEFLAAHLLPAGYDADYSDHFIEETRWDAHDIERERTEIDADIIASLPESVNSDDIPF